MECFHRIDYRFNPLLVICFNGEDTGITVYPDDTWPTIKKQLDKLIKRKSERLFNADIPREVNEYITRAGEIQSRCNNYWDQGKFPPQYFHKLDYKFNERLHLIEICFNGANGGIVIRHEDTWHTIKNRLDAAIDRVKNQESNEKCSICGKDYVKNIQCVCQNCDNFHCYRCYINLFKKGRGIITCPFCHDRSGVRNHAMFKLGVRELENRLR